jgi:outer membrane biosynthesis protein TonB
MDDDPQPAPAPQPEPEPEPEPAPQPEPEPEMLPPPPPPAQDLTPSALAYERSEREAERALRERAIKAMERLADEDAQLRGLVTQTMEIAQQRQDMTVKAVKEVLELLRPLVDETKDTMEAMQQVIGEADETAEKSAATLAAMIELNRRYQSFLDQLKANRDQVTQE